MTQREGFDRGILLLVLMVAVLAVTGVTVALAIRTDEVSDLVADDETIGLVLIIDLGEAGLVTQAVYYQPGTRRAAIFDVPAETGVVVRSLNRVDSIDTVFRIDGPATFMAEVAAVLGTPLRYYVALDVAGLETIVDAIGGLPIFVPDVPDSGPDGVLVPSGDVLLDGAKVEQYLAFSTANERDRERIARHQRVVIALLDRLGAQQRILAHPAAARLVDRAISTNLERAALLSLFGQMGYVNPQQTIARQIEGILRRVETGDRDRQLLFAHQEGRWLRESVRQVVENLSTDAGLRDDNMAIRLEILNGTTVSGLASRTAELYRSYGFDVVAIGNAADDSIRETVVVNHTGNPVFARRAGDIIRAPISPEGGTTQAAVDITVILGSNFDGRYVR